MPHLFLQLEGNQIEVAAAAFERVSATIADSTGKLPDADLEKLIAEFLMLEISGGEVGVSELVAACLGHLRRRSSIAASERASNESDDA